MSRMPLKTLLAVGLALGTAASAAPPEGRPLRGAGTRRLESGAIIRPTREYRQALRSTAAVALGDVRLPHLEYYGGNVIQNVHIVPVLWGSADPAFRTRLDAFYKTFVTCEQFDYLAEYRTNLTSIDGHPGTNQSIGKGTTDTSKIITPANTATTISEGTIVTELNRQLDSGLLPANDANTLYMVHLPPNLVVQDPGQMSCREYCAFHDSFGRGNAQVRFGVIPDHSTGGCATGCGEDADTFNNMTASVSHEVMEAITDPDVGAGNFACGPAWCDPQDADQASSHSENGDICAASVAQLQLNSAYPDITEAGITGSDGNHIVVQREWSNLHAACVTTPNDTFSLVVTPPSQRINGPGTYTFKVKTTVPASGTPPVTIGTFKLPSTVRATITPSGPVAAGTEVTVSLDVGQVTAANLNIAFWAEGPRTQAIAIGSLGADDFKLTAGPVVQLKAGGTATATISTELASGSAGQTLSVTLTGKPPGVSIQGSAPTVTAGQPVTIPLIASPGTPSSTTSSLTFTLSNGIATHTVQVPLNLLGDDFTATEDAPPQLIVSNGGSAQFHLITTTAAGNPQKLTFNATQLPANLTVTFNPPTVQSGASTVATVRANNAPPGPGTLIITVAGLNISTDVTVQTMVQSGGCAGAGGGAGWALAAALGVAAVWLQRRRRPAM